MTDTAPDGTSKQNTTRRKAALRSLIQYLTRRIEQARSQGGAADFLQEQRDALAWALDRVQWCIHEHDSRYITRRRKEMLEQLERTPVKLYIDAAKREQETHPTVR